MVDGFDELCADLFEACGIQKNPFTAKSTETKVSQTTKAFLANDALTTSQNPVLKKHLSEIEQHQDSNALSNAIVQLQSAMQKNSTIPDKIITVLIEAQKHLYFRNFSAALSLLEGTGQFTEDPNIQSALLGTKLQTLLRMEQKTEAAKCADQLLELDCDNHIAAIKKAACLPSIRDRIESLEEFSERATAHFNINNEIAELCIEASQKEASTVDSKGREYKTIAKEHIEKSLVLNPRYNNYAYRMLLTLAEPPHANEIEKAEIQERVFNARYSQSPTSRITLATLHDICKSLRTNAYKNISVEEQAKKSFDRHYPKNRGSYFKVVSDICCEHENHKLLRYFYEMCEKDLSLKSDPEYISEKVSLQYDVYRDVESAISSAEDYCANHPHSGIEKQLFTLYLVENEHEKAQQLLERMSAYLIKEELVMRKARLFEAQSRYSDAIDALCTLENEEFFLEEYSSIISYYHLKNGDYENAKKSAQTLLEKHNFSSKFQTEIINYEFAKQKLGNKISKARIDQIISTPASIELEGVAKLLQNDKAGAIDIFKNEGRKRLSNLDGYLDWPALETIRYELLEYRSSLIKQRRTPDTALVN